VETKKRIKNNMNIIFAIIQNINSDKYYGVSENIEILKGKNKLSFSFELIKRKFYMFLKKKSN
jgi:hypothetical protein